MHKSRLELLVALVIAFVFWCLDKLWYYCVMACNGGGSRLYPLPFFLLLFQLENYIPKNKSTVNHGGTGEKYLVSHQLK